MTALVDARIPDGRPDGRTADTDARREAKDAAVDCQPPTARCREGVSETCGPDGQWTGGTADCTAPTILVVRPKDGENGVLSNEPIEITFSKAMDRKATEGAFSAADIQASSATFEWPANNVMRVTPRGGLKYAEGESLGVQAMRYTVTVTANATDQMGVGLAAPKAWSFTTRRRITLALPLAASESGYIWRTSTGYEIKTVAEGFPVIAWWVNGDDVCQGFTSFDLSLVPLDAAIDKALVRAHGSCEHGACDVNRLEHVTFAAFDRQAFHAAGDNLGPVPMTATAGWAMKDVTPAVRKDIAQRSTKGNYTRFRWYTPAGQIAAVPRRVADDQGPPVLVTTFVTP